MSKKTRTRTGTGTRTRTINKKSKVKVKSKAKPKPKIGAVCTEHSWVMEGCTCSTNGFYVCSICGATKSKTGRCPGIHGNYQSEQGRNDIITTCGWCGTVVS
uniref:Uncharacterized protein n=1 Tax=Mimiviridae sp. ChoanoV1 TaxID=2596887 RepID=A0A5B8IIB5_9VIRU|nr:hypothetical protein 6_17 [Mimiviridae sp. ChoanoV1]